jgi:hypothetical protein
MQCLLPDRHIPWPANHHDEHRQNVSHCISLSGYLLDAIVVSGVSGSPGRVAGQSTGTVTTRTRIAQATGPGRSEQGGLAARMIDWEMP